MATTRDIVSRVRSMNKFLSADNLITDRAIKAELQSKASVLIKRETNLRRLWQSPNLFTPFRCIEMDKVPLSECCDYKSPCNVRKSKKTLPKIAEGIFGLLIQGVYNIDNSAEFKFTTPNRYANLLKLKLPGKQAYYWIYKDHLYVSDENVEIVGMFAYPDEDVVPEEWDSCNPSTEKCPTNPLDLEFRCPSYLIDSVVAMTHDTLMRTYFQHRDDKLPDGKDDQQ